MSDFDRGRFEVFDRITSAYYGKQYYFWQRWNIVYSRNSCKNMTLDDAIDEFVAKIYDDGEV